MHLVTMYLAVGVLVGAGEVTRLAYITEAVRLATNASATTTGIAQHAKATSSAARKDG